MSCEKVPMPASGQGHPKTHSDGVGDVNTHGRGAGGESGGGSYENPHTGKQERGESSGFDGGQSIKGYYGPGQLNGENADSEAAGTVGQGGDLAGTDAGSVRSRAPARVPEPHSVTDGGQTFEVVEASGTAEAERSGEVGTASPCAAKQTNPGSG